jgi:tetratricopeptide (TPR) repeat protein
MEAIEHRRASPAGDDVEALAHHAFRGEAWGEAVTHLRAAAAKTQSRLAGREAAAFLERAILALGHLPETAANRALAIDLRLELDAALAPLGEHARGLAALREAAVRAAASGDDARLARARSFESTALWNLGRAADAIEAGEHALAIARRLGDRELQVVSTFSVGGAARTLGDYRSAAAALRESVALLATGDRRTFGLAGLAAVLVRGHLAWSLAELGDFPTALAYAEEAVQIAQAADHPYSLAHAHLALGGTLVRQGRFTEAATLLERGVALCKDAPALYPATAGDLGLVSVLTGRVARGLELLEHAVAQAERLGRLGRLSLVITHLGEACLLAGRIDEAMAHGRAALARAQAQMERGNQVYALRLLGTIAAQQTPLDAGGASSAFEEALGLAVTLGMLPMAARCHLGLARLARLTGDGAAADRHLATAADAFRAMGMAFWLNRLHLDAVRVA